MQGNVIHSRTHLMLMTVTKLRISMEGCDTTCTASYDGTAHVSLLGTLGWCFKCQINSNVLRT